MSEARDAALERRIQSAYERFVAAPSLGYWAELKTLIYKRSDAQVERMEREKGIGQFDGAYREKLRDPRWQRRRLEIMQRDDFRCAYCRRDDKQLQVHHKVYIRGRYPWEYTDGQLITLCDDCHGQEHAREPYA